MKGTKRSVLDSAELEDSEMNIEKKKSLPHFREFPEEQGETPKEDWEEVKKYVDKYLKDSI